MGCSPTQKREAKYPIESVIREYESTSDFSEKFFLDAAFEINSKIHLDGEFMTNEKFEKYFYRNFNNKLTEDFFINKHIKFNIQDNNQEEDDISNPIIKNIKNKVSKSNNKELFSTVKLKNLLFLLTKAKRIETAKNCFFYDKSSYMFSYIKDFDQDDNDYIKKDSLGLYSFLEDLVVFSVELIPDIWIKHDVRSKEFKNNKLFELRNKIDKIINDIIDKIFNEEYNVDNKKITIESINLMFESYNGFLSSGYIRESALDMLNM